MDNEKHDLLTSLSEFELNWQYSSHEVHGKHDLFPSLAKKFCRRVIQRSRLYALERPLDGVAGVYEAKLFHKRGQPLSECFLNRVGGVCEFHKG